MVASYPASVRLFTAKHDVSDIVLADHVNLLQDEVAALEQSVGLNPAVSSGATAAQTYVTASSAWQSLAARLANIEIGVLADVHTQYLHLAGGDMVQPNADTVRGINIRAHSATQSASLLRVESTDGQTAFLRVDTTGIQVSGTAMVNGNRVLTTADSGGNTSGTYLTSSNLSNSLPSTGARTAGVSGNVSRDDHSHGPTSSRGFTMTLMGA